MGRFPRRFWFEVVSLCGLSLVLTSCIVTYRNSPMAEVRDFGTTQKSIVTHITIPSFPPYGSNNYWLGTIFPALYPLVSTPSGYQEVTEALVATEAFSLVPWGTNPPDGKAHWFVTIGRHDSDFMNTSSDAPRAQAGLFVFKLFEWITMPLVVLEATVAPIPFYSTSAGYKVTYCLHDGQECKRTYSYQISKVGVSWIGLLPFAGVNYFTDDAADAFRATVIAFLNEAERDGYYMKKQGQ
jgi:hypothetical protein